MKTIFKVTLGLLALCLPASAINHIYVDPSINANSGAGTIGDPYGDLQHALDSATKSTTEINQINIKAGSTETLTAALDFTTWGTGSAAGGLVLRGYTSAADDGGRGVINDGGYGVVNDANYDYFGAIDMDFLKGSTGAVTYIINMDNWGMFWRCKFDGNGNATSGTFFHMDNDCPIYDCQFTDIDGTHIIAAGSGVIGCTFVDCSPSSTFIYDANRLVMYNTFIVPLNYAGGVIEVADGVAVINNTIYCSGGGTGYGIGGNAANDDNVILLNNHIEGFSGTGGVAFEDIRMYSIIGGNSTYNCTHDDLTAGTYADAGNNHFDLASSPLADPANGDFSLTGELAAMRGGGIPMWTGEGVISQYIDIGAAQREEPAGGGSESVVGFTGG